MTIYKCDRCKQEYNPYRGRCLSGCILETNSGKMSDMIQMNLCESCSKDVLEFAFGNPSSEVNEKVPVVEYSKYIKAVRCPHCDLLIENNTNNKYCSQCGGKIIWTEDQNDKENNS